ncbi:hypothetical protein D3C74_236480 [compost metagenome]
MPGPVGVAADIRYCGESAVTGGVQRTVHDPFDGRSFAFQMAVKVQYFLPLGYEIADMVLLPGIFLGDLKLDHLVRQRHRAQQRRYRLAHLKVNRTVFDLQDDVLFESPVQRDEMIVGGPCPIRLAVSPVLLAVVNEASPDHEPAVRLQRLGQHIGAVGMIPPIGERSRPVLRIRLHQEPAKVRDRSVNLRCAFAPPGRNLRFKRIGGR